MTSNFRSYFTKYKSIKDFENNTHISLKNKYVFVQVSKAGSSSVKWLLQSLEFRNTPWKVIDVNNKFYSPHLSPYQLDDATIDNVFTSGDFKKVAFVRNPYSRLLSCYLHRIIGNPRTASNKYLSKITDGRCGPEISFNEFVDVICKQESLDQESHWRSQFDDLCVSDVKYDFIGKVENIANDLKSIASYLYGDAGKRWVKKNSLIDSSPMVTKSSNKLLEYYSSDAIIEKVYRRFEKDFEFFGYSKEL